MQIAEEAGYSSKGFESLDELNRLAKQLSKVVGCDFGYSPLRAVVYDVANVLIPSGNVLREEANIRTRRCSYVTNGQFALSPGSRADLFPDMNPIRPRDPVLPFVHRPTVATE